MMVNVHLSHRKETQINSCNKTLDLIKSKNVDGYLVCGDFNMTSESNDAAYTIMTSNGTKDMERTAIDVGTDLVTGGTFHDYGKRNETIRIDFFFGSDNLRSNMYTVATDTFDGLYPSDHYGIVNYVSIR